MKLRFEKPKGQRIYKQFLYVKVEGMWWGDVVRSWMPMHVWESCCFEDVKLDLTSAAKCRTVKAFRRMIRKNPWIRGRARLISRFEGGYDVWG